MLKWQWRLRGGPMCTLWYICVTYLSKAEYSSRYQNVISWYSPLPWYIPRLGPSKSLAAHLTSHLIISHINSVAEIPSVNNLAINYEHPMRVVLTCSMVLKSWKHAAKPRRNWRLQFCAMTPCWLACRCLLRGCFTVRHNKTVNVCTNVTQRHVRATTAAVQKR